MSCKTMFHDLLSLVETHMPEEKRYEFYRELLQVTHTHGISLDFLLGEDAEFDRAYRSFMEV